MIFIDETWIYQNGSPVLQWVHDTDLKSNSSKIKEEGKRFTILHAGCASGFLPGCELILDTKNNDYTISFIMQSQIHLDLLLD